MPFTIIAEDCTGCTACEQRCPTKAISGAPRMVYFIEPALCIDCGACGVICPDDAILDTYGNVTHVLKKHERPIAIVHPDNCNGCGVCIDVCPFDCIYPSPNNGPEYLGNVEVNESSCVGCKLCEEVCGWEGIYIMPAGEKGSFLEGLGPEAEEANAG
ncbi:MAG: 4Fe-4S binding protein [Deltaproteobacteria bacterium]|nr:4Fe-4S binding protein [Deltaproteobacteria bacterium]MBI3390760.1 4Fe-4S binding protein [Deltaproteobacteria bacterium]